MGIDLKTSGVHHIALRTVNLDRSKHFYKQLLGFPLLMEAPGIFLFLAGSTAVAVRGPESGTAPSDRFDPLRVGLDHVALGCTDENELQRVASALSNAAIWNTGVKLDTSLNKNYLGFKDPDGIKWELYMAKNPSLEVAESYLRGLNKGDLSEVPFSRDLVFESPLTPRLNGVEPVREFLEGVLPVIKGARILDSIANDDRVVIRFELDTSHGVIPACDFIRIKDGCISEIRPYYDPRPITNASR
jgi:glyoxylase I family protein